MQAPVILAYGIFQSYYLKMASKISSKDKFLILLMLLFSIPFKGSKVIMAPMASTVKMDRRG